MNRSRPAEVLLNLVAVPVFIAFVAVTLICCLALALAFAFSELCSIPRRVARRRLKARADRQADPLALAPDTWIDVLYRDRPRPVTIRRGSVDWFDHECAPELWRLHKPTG